MLKILHLVLEGLPSPLPHGFLYLVWKNRLKGTQIINFRMRKVRIIPTFTPIILDQAKLLVTHVMNV